MLSSIRSNIIILSIVLLSACSGGGSGSETTEVNLDSLSIIVGDLDQVFQSTQLSYTASVGFLATSIQVKATSSDTNANIKINNVDIDADNLSQSITLSEGENSAIEITVSKNTVTKTYTLTITRQTLANLAEQAALHGSDAQATDYAGYSVSLSGDTLAVGAYREDGGTGDPASDAGAVYIYTRSGSTWTEQKIVYASDQKSFDYFGRSVSLSGDTLAVGASSEDGGVGDPASDSGAAYIYQ